MAVKVKEQSGFLRWLHKANAMPYGSDPGAFDPAAVEHTVEVAERFFGPGRYFGLDVQGWDNVPRAPAMVISNHSGGTTIPDVWGFGVAWYARFGVGRIIHPMAHEIILSTKRTGRFFERHGVLRASREMGYDVLTNWKRDLMVMPGGDRDTWRPYKKRYEVTFAGRTGYARLAIKAGVPIVPVANAGAHETLFVLTDGSRLARALGMQRRFRASIFPISLSFPWGLTIGPLPHLPWPADLRYRIGPAIAPPALDVPGAEPTDEQVRDLDSQVRAAVQTLLDDLSK